jgi:hypothetical protein
MGQRSNSECRASPEPHLLRPGSRKEKDEEERVHPSQSPEEQAVPELIDHIAKKMDTLVDEVKKLTEELRDP